MGGCGTKSAGSQDDVVNPGRKRLSMSKSDQASDKNGEKDRGTVKSADEVNILDLISKQYPNSQPRLSVCGSATENKQQGFADKKVEKSSFLEDHSKVCRTGYVCKKGLKPESPNQDDFCVYCTDMISIFGVFDGHGPFGQEISHFAHETLPETFVKDPKFFSSPEKALNEAFRKTHDLCVERQQALHFDCALSGTTATLAFFNHKEDKLCVGHVGDVRAVLAKGPRSASEFRPQVLTRDHKADDEAEAKRITEKGGQIRRLEGDIPRRVFIQDQSIPGLAMTRAIGDTEGRKAGVISEPDVKSFELEKGEPDEEWRFLLICSDGVWDFIDDKEAVNIVAAYPPPDAQNGAEALASEAWNRWIEEEKDLVDDITVIVHWFADKK